jgi:hypothetical protein
MTFVVFHIVVGTDYTRAKRTDEVNPRYRPLNISERSGVIYALSTVQHIRAIGGHYHPLPIIVDSRPY